MHVVQKNCISFSLQGVEHHKDAVKQMLSAQTADL